jgi:hypothetical protein
MNYELICFLRVVREEEQEMLRITLLLAVEVALHAPKLNCLQSKLPLSLSLSLSLSLTHTHTHILQVSLSLSHTHLLNKKLAIHGICSKYAGVVWVRNFEYVPAVMPILIGT